MAKLDKIRAKVLSGQSDANIPFADLVKLLESFGFEHRQQGSHHIFTKAGIRQRVNLQADGPKAKRYQVKQVREVLTKNEHPENE
jgi:virulence-associated protein VapD